jgi:ubiquinone/menaquinone biosynthesis C-methylase UbiE
MVEGIYLHGYTDREQQRLLEQALFLKSWVYDGLDFSGVENMLEIGSGVGAQTTILLSDNPSMKVTGLDHSEKQIEKAKLNLSGFPEFAGRYEFLQRSGIDTGFDNESFDGIFLCWILEHVSDPLAVMKESFRVLKKGGKVYASEVFNNTFFTYPETPVSTEYWEIYNKFQQAGAGDPNAGIKTGNFLKAAGFTDIKSSVRYFIADETDTVMKKKIINYWTELMLSGVPNLLEAGLITEDMPDKFVKEMTGLITNPMGVFYCSFIRTVALK